MYSMKKLMKSIPKEQSTAIGVAAFRAVIWFGFSVIAMYKTASEASNFGEARTAAIADMGATKGGCTKEFTDGLRQAFDYLNEI